MKRVLAALCAVIASVCLALPAMAATGPFTIKTLNANVCVGFAVDAQGEPVIQEDASGPSCRNMYFNQLGHLDGHPYGEWETSSGLAMASPDCQHVELVPALGSTGTSWVNFVIAGGGGDYLVSKHCDEQSEHGRCIVVLGATGITGQEWVVADRLTNPGLFSRIHLIRTSPAPPKVLWRC